MNQYNLIKTKAGERTGSEVSHFFGNDIEDPQMLIEVEIYLRAWLDSTNSLSYEEIDELFSSFEGSFRYDVWTFELVPFI